MTSILICVFILLSYLAWKFSRLKRKHSVHQERLEEISNFKGRADAIQVDLSDITVKSNSWQEEVIIDNSKYGGYNQIGGRADLNIEMVQHNINVLQFTIPYKGGHLSFETLVCMDPTVLRMKLALKESTTLYVNPSNPSEYYLDLEFLDT